MRPTVADSIDAQHGGSSIESTLPNGSEDPRDFSDGDAGDVESVWLAHDTEAERTVWLAHDTEAERTLNGEFGEEYFVNCQPSVTAIHDDGHNEIEETDILGGIDANTDLSFLASHDAVSSPPTSHTYFLGYRMLCYFWIVINLIPRTANARTHMQH
ncbi:hypothetical protein LTR66_006644 [Elasticomyces elasticus]|nr:hypothetical protein LTR66_006644 [Elasticomyces elasticus]